MAVTDLLNEEQFRRVVGERGRAQPGQPPTRAVRSALATLGNYATGAPKGVFRYRSHEEANGHREAWTIARIVAARSSSGGAGTER
jgi:hypothetical protein